MTGLSAQLDRLREVTTGCQLAAFGDLETEVMLLSSSRKERPREYLDTLSADAARAFRAYDRFARSERPPAGHATVISVMTPEEVRHYFRPPSGGQDFLCLVCDDPQSGEELTDQVQPLWDELERGQNG